MKLSKSTLISFLVTLILSFVIIFIVIFNRSENEKLQVEQITLGSIINLSDSITSLLTKIETLALIAKNPDYGKEFNNMAPLLLDNPVILNFLLAPNGVVEHVYTPYEGGESVLGFDFFQESSGNLEAMMAIELRQTVIAGPFLSVQGQEVLAARRAVFVNTPDGGEELWGIVSVTLKFPEVFDSLNIGNWSNESHPFELWRINPDTGERQVLLSNDEKAKKTAQTMVKHFPILHADWYLDVTYGGAWYTYLENWLLLCVGLIVSFFVLALLHKNDSFNRMKRRLKEEERILLMLDSAPICCQIWNKERKTIGCNEAAVKLYDLSSKEEYAERFLDFSPEFQPDGQRSLEKAIALVNKAFEGQTVEFEWLHLHPNGTLIPAEITLIGVPYGDERVVLGYTRDLRKQKELTDKLSEALDQALAASNTKSIFLANMSHEIRTPLNAILGMSEIQLQKETLPPNTEEAFNIIYDSAELLGNIINDILDFSKIETGKLEFNPTIYDITDLINDCVGITRMRYESKPIDFVLKADPNTPLSLKGDELRLKQILNNLLSNAYKYTDRGSVKLEIFTIETDENNIILTFRVSDSGQGMTEEEIAAIFEEYARFNLKKNIAVSGAGLGMSITKRLLDLMNGTISVESKPGKGSVFTVEIPQERAGTEVIGPAFEENFKVNHLEYNLRSNKTQFTREYMPYGKVLIVDDVETNLFVAKGLLVPYGLMIDTVTSGFEAIELVKSGHTYDIIFMDHMMPQLDGMETAKFLRESGYNQPIVALTANAAAGQADYFLANGFDAFIPKPIDMNELNIVLNELIRDKQPSEMIEAARRENKETVVPAEKIYTLAESVIAAFLRDAKKALAVLDVLYAKLTFEDEKDIQLYITSVHGMKNALEIIGEQDLSAFAFDLEQAGRERNMELLLKKTPTLLDNIRSLVSKINLLEDHENEGEFDIDEVFLVKKMAAIKEACAEFDKKTIKQALTELKGKVWSHQTVSDLESRRDCRECD
ncbi:MAG: ATP-binding protein [Lachnospiraceae bacterium]|nr:ATP-binding protein [Lachnospiraceae bacterium]